MAVDKIVIEIVGDTKDIDSTIKQLEKVGKVDRKNAKSFKKSSKEFQNQQTKNISSIDKLAKQALRLGPIILGAFAVSTITRFTSELSATAIQMEAFQRRAKVVFGESVKFVEEFGKANAKNLGLTQNAFLGAAAAVGDILVPLGLSRKRAAEMSAEAVKLGSALREFTGDQRSAAEISEIVAKSFTGEVEGLKGLGVVVNQNDKAFKALVKTKIINEGLTEQQAKAEAIFTTVLMRSGDALNSFETNTDSAARQQAIFDANMEEVIETMAVKFLPVLNFGLKVLNSFAETTQDVTNSLLSESKALEAQEKEINALVDRYKQLKTESELNVEEQEELRDIIADLALRVPEAASEFDEYNKVIDINTTAIDNNLKRQQEVLRLRFKERIAEIRDELEKQNESLAIAEKNFAAYQRGIFVAGQGLVTATEEGIAKWNLALLDQNRLIAESQLELSKLGVELTDIEKEFIDATLGTNTFRKATKKGGEDAVKQARNIFFLKNAISALRKEQAAQGTTTQRVAEINKELIPLQKEINGLLGKVTKATKGLTKEQEKQIDTQALFQETIKKTIAVFKELAEEEEEFAAEGSDFAIAQFQKTLDGRRQALEIELASEEISQEEFNFKVAQLDKEAADNKIREVQRAADATGAIANASFNLLIGLQDRKLQLLENETTVEIRELQERRDQNLITEEEFEEQRRAILKETDEKRRELLTKRAKLAKIAAIIEATINTAVAITEALPNAPLAALVAILGAAEIATIAAQPIPEFHGGKKSELKEGEMYAKILKSESVIPPEQSKRYKGAIDSMIDKKFENYVFHEYMLPMIKGMGKKEISEPYNDIMLWNNQKKQILLTRETNKLLKGLQPNDNPWRSWR